MKRQPRDPYRDNLVNRRWVSSSHSLLCVVGGQQQTSWTAVYLLMHNLVNDLHGLWTKPKFPFHATQYVCECHSHKIGRHLVQKYLHDKRKSHFMNLIKTHFNLCNVSFMIIVNFNCYGRRKFKLYCFVLCKSSCGCVCVMYWIMEICTCTAFLWLLKIRHKTNFSNFLSACCLCKVMMCVRIQRLVL